MKNIRIGNDIHVRWRIMRQGSPEDFDGKDVHVCLSDQYGGRYYPDIALSSEGTIEFTFFGKDQVKTGTYNLTLTENGGRKNMVAVDRTAAFRLVASQNRVMYAGTGSSGCGCSDGLEIDTVELSTELMIPALGKGVVRCYNIARDTWGRGLATDGETVYVKLSGDNPGLEFDRDGGLRATGNVTADVVIAPDSQAVLENTPEGLRFKAEGLSEVVIPAISDEEIENLWGADSTGIV